MKTIVEIYEAISSRFNFAEVSEIELQLIASDIVQYTKKNIPSSDSLPLMKLILPNLENEKYLSLLNILGTFKNR